MYNVYDKSNVYFLYRYSKNSHSLIGDRNALIKMLANAFRSTFYFDDVKDYNDCSRWSNCFFDDVNMGSDITCVTHFNYVRDENEILHEVVTKDVYNKEYLFYDGMNRIVDVREFKLEAFHYFVNHRNDKRPYRYYRYNRYKQWKYGHCGTYYHHQAPKNRKCVRKLDAMFDSEYKEYHFKHLEDSNNPYPDWWDDAARRVEGNWKSQYKVNRQYNIHKNAKNNKSIRKDFFEDFSLEEIDDMLFEDFKNNDK